MSCVGSQFHPKNFESSPCLGNPNHPSITQEGVEPLNPIEKHRGVRDLTFSSTWSSRVAGCWKVAQHAACKMAAWSTNTYKPLGLVSLGLSFLPSVQAETQSQENAQESFSWGTFALASLTTIAVGIAAGRYIFRKPAVYAQKIGMVNPLIQGDAHIYMGGYDAKEHKGSLDQVLKVNLPTISPFFTGRQKELEEIYSLFEKHPRVVITGLGGVGKSAVVLQYVKQHGERYQRVFYIDGATPVTIDQGIASAADTLGIVGQSPSERVKKLGNLLTKDNRSLLIFDGVDDPQTFQYLEEHLLLKGDHHILLTSRMSQESVFRLQCTPVSLHLWSCEDSVDYVQKVTGQSLHADVLAKTLGFFPLALTHACAYIKQRHIMIESFLKVFDAKQTEIFKERFVKPTKEHTLLTTWNMSLSYMRPEAVELLDFCSFLAPVPVARSFLIQWTGTYYPQCDGDQLIGELTAYSMMHSFSPETYGVHHLVQQVIRDRLSPAAQNKHMESFVLFLQSHAERFDWSQRSTRDYGKYCFIQLEWIKNSYPKVWEAAEPYTKWVILRQVGIWLRFVDTNVEKAQEYFSKALWLSKQSHLDSRFTPFEVAISMKNLGVTWRDTGNHRLAKRWMRKAIQTLQNMQGDPKVLAKAFECLCDLGTIMGKEGDHEAAQRAFQEAYVIVSQLHKGASHPHVAFVQGHLADVCLAQGKYQDAIKSYEEARSIYEGLKDGRNYTLEVYSMNEGLGNAFFSLGEMSTALEFYESAKKQYIEIHGEEEHPVIIELYKKIGNVYCAQGFYGTAQKTYQKAWEISRKVWGDDHASTNALHKMIEDIGNASFSRGEFDKALELYELAQKQYVEVYGTEEHPVIIELYKKIGNVYFAQELYLEAQKAYQNAWEISRKVWGDDHASTGALLKMLKGLDREVLLDDQQLISRLDTETSTVPRTIPKTFPEFKYHPVYQKRLMDVYIIRKAVGYEIEDLVPVGRSPGPIDRNWMRSRRYKGREERKVQTGSTKEKIGEKTRLVKNPDWDQQIAKVLEPHQESIEKLQNFLHSMRFQGGQDHVGVAQILYDLGRAYDALGKAQYHIGRAYRGRMSLKKAVQYYQESLTMREKFCEKGIPDDRIFNTSYDLIHSLLFLLSHKKEKDLTLLLEQVYARLVKSCHAQASGAQQKITLLEPQIKAQQV